jgi:protein O-mannosyl-transferase
MQSLLVKCKLFIIAGLLLLAFSWISYSGNSSHELLAWDDEPYITNNNWVTNPSFDNVVSIFTESKVSNWHPLTWLSYIPEYYLCDTTASCYKNTNIFLHGINAFLVFLLSGIVLCLLLPDKNKKPFEFSSLTEKEIFAASLMSAILFCVHPQRAESVIWVAERKDLLCGIFYLLGLIVYIYQHSSTTSKSKSLSYAPFALFILAAMSKSMAITFPAILILLDFTLLGRRSEKSGESVSQAVIRIALREKIHFHVVTVMIAAVTLLSQSVASIDQPTILERLLISISAIDHYIFTFFAPFNLSPFYPVEALSNSIIDYWPFALVFGFFLTLILFGKQRNTVLLFIGYFLLVLSPVIGVIKVGDHVFADRYTYLSMIGFYILAGHGISRVAFADKRFSIPVIFVFCLVAGLLSFTTHQYKNTWQDDLTFWGAIESDYPDTSALIYTSLGLAYLSLAEYPEAEANFQKSIEIDANRPEAYVDLGAVYQRTGDSENFLRILSLGVENNPENAELVSGTGMGFLSLGLNDQALEYFIRALELELNFPPALMGVGSIMLGRGEQENAISMLELVPENSSVEFPDGLLLAQAYAFVDKNESLIILEELRAKYGRDEQIDPVIDYVNEL